MAEDTTVDPQALDAMSVAPPHSDKAPGAEYPAAGSAAEANDAEKPAVDPRQQAGQDESIARRLEKNPQNPDAQLDAGLDESMDASDPPAATQPGSSEPAPSSGFDPEAEARLQGGG
jgi:hypothetical protein